MAQENNDPVARLPIKWQVLIQLGPAGVMCLLMVFGAWALTNELSVNRTMHAEELKNYRAELIAQRRHDETMRTLTHDMLRDWQMRIIDAQRQLAESQRTIIANQGKLMDIQSATTQAMKDITTILKKMKDESEMIPCPRP